MRVSAWFAFVPLIVAACEAAQGGTEAENVEGLRLYRAQYCGTCHAFTAAGTAGVFGPPHDGMRAIAEQRIRSTEYAGAATTAEAYIRESLLEPGVYRVPQYAATRYAMPAYTSLTDDQVDALVRLLLDPRPVTGGSS